MTSTDRRLPLAKINLAVMLNDAKAALYKVTDEGKNNVLQAGVCLGLSAAGHVLGGLTADEAWAKVEPLFAMVHADAGGPSG